MKKSNILFLSLFLLVLLLSCDDNNQSIKFKGILEQYEILTPPGDFKPRHILLKMKIVSPDRNMNNQSIYLIDSDSSSIINFDKQQLKKDKRYKVQCCAAKRDQTVINFISFFPDDIKSHELPVYYSVNMKTPFFKLEKFN